MIFPLAAATKLKNHNNLYVAAVVILDGLRPLVRRLTREKLLKRAETKNKVTNSS